MLRQLPFFCTVALAISLCGCDESPTAPTPVFELTLSRPIVPAGAASEGIVTLRSRTRSAIQIRLSSSDAVASVPPTIVVPSGSLIAAFTVTTRVVAADTLARIAATAGDTRQEIALHVVAAVARPATP